MKLVRLGPVGREVPGVMVGDPPEFFDARSVTPDYDSDFFAASGLDRLREAVDAGALRRLESAGLRIAAPLRRPGKIVCIGLNYRQHVNESGMEIPSEPVVFMKASNTIVGPHDDVIIPRTSRKTDWEVELAVVIGSTTSYLDDPSEASARIAGYAISNDVSEREFQLERGGQWDKGKSCATFNPLGPWIATTDEIGDPQQLDIYLDLNGERLQSANTSDMIFPVDYLIWYLSAFMVLDPGDIINTGTPAGVGLGLRPPRYLVPGDRLDLGISGLGAQRSCAVAAR
jgi:2-keto-4-pentenoate hydratase/2-oxohepta-3-ene-1,7-dioic acid hydratase in catechol pathway